MEVEYERDMEELGGAERDVGVREGPVGVDDVGFPLAADLDALEEPADDVGDGEELQPGPACHLGGGAFFVREDFPVGRGVAEPVDGRAVDGVALEPLVGGREHLDVQTSLLEVGDGRSEPRYLGVLVVPRVNGTDDENFYFCWMHAGYTMGLMMLFSMGVNAL